MTYYSDIAAYIVLVASVCWAAIFPERRFRMIFQAGYTLSEKTVFKGTRCRNATARLKRQMFTETDLITVTTSVYIHNAITCYAVNFVKFNIKTMYSVTFESMVQCQSTKSRFALFRITQKRTRLYHRH